MQSCDAKCLWKKYKDESYKIIPMLERKHSLVNLIVHEMNVDKKNILEQKLFDLEIEIEIQSEISGEYYEIWQIQDEIEISNCISVEEIQNSIALKRQQKDNEWLGCMCLLFPPLLIFALPYWLWKLCNE